jgi:hypothetical protein
MRNFIFGALAIGLGVVAGCGSSRNPAAEKAALEASGVWLELIDRGEYPQSWEDAAGFFKSGVTAEEWQKAMERARRPLGKVLSRKIKSKEYVTAIPGAPEGEYVILEYETSFENQESAREILYSVFDLDGTWRISGYYLLD